MKKSSWLWLALCMMTVVGCNPTDTIPPGGVREFTLVMENMRFIGEKPDGIHGMENPELVVYLGDKVRITLSNKESQLIVHDFAISNYPEVRLSRPLRPEQSAVVEFEATRAGEFTYYSPLHPTLMTGRFLVLRR